MVHITIQEVDETQGLGYWSVRIKENNGIRLSFWAGMDLIPF